MSLAQRSVQSAGWATFTTVAALPVNFVHSVLLARLLPVEYFGIYAGVGSVILLSSTFFEFGFTNAFLHRSVETEDETRAASAFFTLRLIFEFTWAISLIVFGSIAFSGLHRYTLIVLVLTQFLYRLTLTPKVVLIRRVLQRRLSVIDLAASITSALISLTIAYLYHSIWALLISSIITMIFSIIGLFLWRPVWRPKMIWDKPIFHYFFRFGSKNLVNNILDSALENVDNLWTGAKLGDLQLGYYSRAYKFSIYPRMILAAPITSVALGTYAELKQDRKRLSRAFFQTNAFLIRAGFFLAGWLAVIAPYLITFLLGERWLPMLTAFRLMLIYAMLDPIKGTISNVLVAVGVPERITSVRVVQVLVLAAGLFSLGIRYQIAGVAMSMDLMVIIGTVLSIIYVRRYVDVSWSRMFRSPLIAIVVGLGITWLIGAQIHTTLPPVWSAFTLTIVLPLVYFFTLFLLEGKELIQNAREIISLISLPVWMDSILRFLSLDKRI